MTAQAITLKSSDAIDQLSAKYGHAVQCHRQTRIPDLKDSNNTANATVYFDRFEIQPFDVPSSGKFGEGKTLHVMALLQHSYLF